MSRMLMPAMYNLYLQGHLPAAFAIVGVASTNQSDDQFRDAMKASIAKFSRSGPAQDPAWGEFAKRLSYVAGKFDDPRLFKALHSRIEANDKNFGTKHNRLFYCSTPPQLFTTIVDHIDKAGLGPKSNPSGFTRIVVEKPFGFDLQSASALQTEITKVFDESQIYRMDHFLGKEPVQDIMALRFANTIFEPIWNRRHIESVRITAAETVGVEHRGGYYEGAGALRDMIQNHVLNLLALVAMEPPVKANADAIRDEKAKVMCALHPIEPADVFNVTARGQYGPGSIDGQPVAGYRQEPNVDPNSNTETYAAVRFLIDNWRWGGVPFYLRSGKRLASKFSEIAIRFKPIPHRLFGELDDVLHQNWLIMKVQPTEGVSIRFSAKVPGPMMHLRTVDMDFDYATGFEGVVSPPAYERLIGDAMRGDATLFTRWDAVEIAWERVMPIVERWKAERDATFPNYPAGSQGPRSADELLAKDGTAWRAL